MKTAMSMIDQCLEGIPNQTDNPCELFQNQTEDPEEQFPNQTAIPGASLPNQSEIISDPLLKPSDLHGYQTFCAEFLLAHPEALLILDMGLGKTIITLTAIAELLREGEAHRILIVAPLRVARNVWPAEKDKWEHTRSLRMSVITGSAKEREVALEKPADIYVINRENVVWLLDFLNTWGMPWSYDTVVLDELSSFKNGQAKRWKALRMIRPFVNRMIGLTGTPASNGLMDLWAETYLIDRGQRLGRFITSYREAFFRPGRMNPATGVVYDYIPLAGAEEEIYSRLSDITVSMKAADYLDMPELTLVSHRVFMDAWEQDSYDVMKENMIVQLGGEEINAANAAALSGKLQQMAGGQVYNEVGEAVNLHRRKLEMLSDLIEAANGQSVLVACWFRHERDRIHAWLKKDMRLEVRDLKTEQDIADWNAGRISVAVISPAGAGHGLNLQKGGHILIWYSLTWSLELYLQTNARLWRQGQTERVTIHHILTKDTIDESVMKALDAKDCTQRRLIDAVKAQLGNGKRQKTRNDAVKATLGEIDSIAVKAQLG